MGRLLLILGAALLTGCTSCNQDQRTGGTGPSKGTVRVRAITDAEPVRLLVPAGTYLFSAGTHGIDRWDPLTDRVLSLSADHGLPGDRVLAVAPDVERMWLWIATDGGLGYYDVAAETFAEIPASKVLDVAAGGDLHLAPATDGGVWIGHARGLFYANPAGQWTSTPIDGPISALGLGEDGWLWIGTAGGLVGRQPNGESFKYGATEGCDVTKVRLITRAPGGGVMVIGENQSGKQRLAVRRGQEKAASWSSFKIQPHVTIDSVAAIDDGVIAKGGRRLYHLSAVGANKRKLLTRDSVRLLAVSGDAARDGGSSSLTIELLPAALPGETTAIAAIANDVYVGTRDVGIGRWRGTAPQPVAWLRKRELLDGATTLTVACKALDDCWVATGTRHAWYFDGGEFRPSGPEAQAVLAVVRDEDHAVYALHRAGEANSIYMSRIDAQGTTGDVWTEIAGARMKTPGDKPEISFARYAPGGVLWVGLRYQDGRDVRPWGVALVDIAVGMVAYHHASADRKERKQGVLPIPVDVVDATFASEDEVWLATTEGAARLVGTDLTIWNETNGMASEVTRAIAVSPGGFVFVATGAGIGLFDGEAWSFPRELSFQVNDLAIARDGKLWMATDRGIALYDGKKVKRLDVRRGLLENEIIDIAIDAFDRVWARGAESLTLISP
jgi:ligand-binding sensor domain-containing protein